MGGQEAQSAYKSLSRRGLKYVPNLPISDLATDPCLISFDLLIGVKVLGVELSHLLEALPIVDHHGLAFRGDQPLARRS